MKDKRQEAVDLIQKIGFEAAAGRLMKKMEVGKEYAETEVVELLVDQDASKEVK